MLNRAARRRRGAGGAGDEARGEEAVLREGALEDFIARWRLPLLVSAVILILLVPYLLIRQWTTESQAAQEWVRHTHEVQAAAREVEATIRRVDSLGMAVGLSPGNPELHRRLEEAIAEVGPALERLVALTRDNPEQMRLAGRLETLFQRRIEGARALAMGVDDPEKVALVDQLYGRYQIRELLQEFIGNEAAMLSERARYAEWQRWRVRWLGLGALLVQLLLMGLVIYLLHRQERYRMQSERRLSKASERARAVLATVREPIVVLDGQLRVVMHNPAFAELYDGDPGRTWDRSVALEEIGDAWRDPMIRQRLSDVLTRGRELWDYEHIQRTVDGQVRTMMVNARRMQLPDRDDDVVLMTVSDITVQKTAQARIAELNRQLEGKVEQVSEVNRELEAFSYSVSHDLRAPLRHVAGFSDKLAQHLGASLDDKARHYLEVIGDSARRMSALIDDLLVYSRLGRHALKLQPVDMQSLAEETRAVLDSGRRAEAEAEGRQPGRVEWHIAPLPVVVADENMMRQVWLNLLGNAVKYSAGRDPAVIEVGYERMPDGQHHFSVRDNGVGFDMAYAGKLFGVFQRLHKASEFPGTGIGLASVRRVLARHGGRIWAESEPDRGATFHFILPPGQDSTNTLGSPGT